MNRPGTPELITAIRANDLARVRELIAGGADVNARDRFRHPEHGITLEAPLYAAIQRGNMDIFTALLDAGAEVNTIGSLETRAPLVFDALRNLRFAEELVRRGASLQGHAEGLPLLHYVAFKGFPYPSIRFALENGGNIRLRAAQIPRQDEILLAPPRELNAFEYAVLGRQGADVLKYLLDEDLEAERNRIGATGEPLLHIGNYPELLADSSGPSQAFLRHWKSIFDRRRHALSAVAKSRRAHGGRRARKSRKARRSSL